MIGSASPRLASTDDATPCTGRRIGLSYRAVSGLVGTLLLVAAAFKAHGLLTGGVAGDGPLESRWSILSVVEFEWLFGLWLLLGLSPPASRRVAIGIFGAFALVSLRKAVSGEASCGCFGRFAVNPWITSVVDCVAVAALVVARPGDRAGSSSGANRVALATFLTLGLWVGGGWAIFASAAASDPLRVALRTEEWSGQRLPILEQIEIGEDLARGEWVVLLYRHDCRECREELPKFDRRARLSLKRGLKPRFALVELPPHAGPGEQIVPEGTPCALGHLPATREWVLRTPLEIVLKDGIVVPRTTPEAAGNDPPAGQGSRTEPAPAARDAGEIERIRSETHHKLVVAYLQDAIEGGKLGRDHFTPQFLELVDGNPDDLFGYDSLLMLVTGDHPEGPHFRKSMDLLLRHHVQGSQAAGLCRWFTSPAYFGTLSEPVIRYIERVAADNSDPDVRAGAAFDLALFLKNKADLAKQISRANGAGLASKMEGIWGRPYVDALQGSDPEKLAAQAARRIERAAAEFPGYRESHLLAGSPAPPLVGQDIWGDRLELRQFRDKVVALTFWGFGCLPCRAMFPHERALVDRLEGSPFVLLGVNNDLNRDEVRSLMVRERIAWKSWWDGGETGNPIAAAWGIRSWPSIFVLDHRGVIRYRDVRGKALDIAIDSLLLEIGQKRP